MEAELIASLGDDLTVVNAARVSFDKESDWKKNVKSPPADKELYDKDIKLIKYLAKHNHFTPFTHCSITLRETVPIFVARQRFKHTIGFTYNEVSRRYVDDLPEFYIPTEWRKKADDRKQGSSEETIDINPYHLMIDDYLQSINKAKWTYIHLLDLASQWHNIIMLLFPESWISLTTNLEGGSNE